MTRALLAAAGFVAVTVVLAVLIAPEPGAAPLRFGLAVALQLAVAALSWPALGLAGARRVTALAGGWAVLVLAPLLIPGDAEAERVLAAIIGVALMLKVYDVNAAAAAGRRTGLREFLRFLPNLTSMSIGGLKREPRPGPRRSARDLAGALGLLALVVLALMLLRRVAWAEWPLALEHGAKALVLFVGFVAVMDVMTHVTRLGGGTARDVNAAPWLATTPAEFWRRYNRTIGQFLEEHAFRPALRRTGSPTLAVLAAFALSGVVHEYIFTMASGRLQGYQMTFFLIQGAAVAATARARIPGRLAWLAVPLTIAFILASSLPFFLSFDTVAPLYVAR